MNVTTRNLIAAVLSVLAGSASVANAADTSVGHLNWNCDRAGAPTLQEVKTLYDTPSNYLASLLRERLVSKLRAECQKGPSNVLVVLNPPSPTTEPVLVAAADPHVQARRDLATR